MTSKGVGIPVKLLHESEGHVITVRVSSLCAFVGIGVGWGGKGQSFDATMHGPGSVGCAPKPLATV